MSFAVYCLMFVNVAGLVLCFWDKHCARKHRWRVPEKVFFVLGFLMGTPGIVLGMILAHHKVSKPSFVRVIAADGLWNLIAVLLLWKMGISVGLGI